MAYDKRMRNKFIEMYAKGISLSEISRELNISLPTLNKWKEESATEIYTFKNKLKKDKENEIEEMITERIKLLNNELEKAYKALENISLNKMKNKNLLYFIEKLENKINDPLLDGRENPNVGGLIFFDEFGEEIEDFQRRLSEKF
jgi:5'-deoxynucleotidase YfbR-like HD superfamily hydrolase